MPSAVELLGDRLGRLRPAAYSANIRRTIAASAGSIRRRPRSGRPSRSGAPGHHGIAVAAAAAGAALLDPAAQAAMRLQRQVLQEERVHRALEPDMQLADLALGHRHQPHAGEATAA